MIFRTLKFIVVSALHCVLILAASCVSATTIYLYDVTGRDIAQDGYGLPIASFGTITTETSGVVHYAWQGGNPASGFPAGVDLGIFRSNMWIHEDSRNGELSFGWIFGKRPGLGAVGFRTVTAQFRVLDSTGDPIITVDDDPREEDIREDANIDNLFIGAWLYDGTRTDGVLIGGLAGERWKVEILSTGFGNNVSDGWWVVDGASGIQDDGYFDQLVLDKTKLYVLSPALLPEPSTLAIVVPCLFAVGARKRG